MLILCICPLYFHKFHELYLCKLAFSLILYENLIVIVSVPLVIAVAIRYMFFFISIEMLACLRISGLGFSLFYPLCYLYIPAFFMSSEMFNEFLQKELGVTLTPPIGKQKAEGWKGLDTERLLEIKFEDTER